MRMAISSHRNRLVALWAKQMTSSLLADLPFFVYLFTEAWRCVYTSRCVVFSLLLLIHYALYDYVVFMRFAMDGIGVASGVSCDFVRVGS